VNAARFLLYGATLGIGLPVIATFVEARHRYGGDLRAAWADSPLLWLIVTTPLVVAALAWMVGRRQDQVLQVDADRAAALDRTAQELAGAATALFGSVSAFSAMTADTAASVQQTTQTMTSLSQTAMRAALTAETVIGLAQKSTRKSEEGLRSVEQSVAGMVRLAEDVKVWAGSTDVLSEKLRAIFAIHAVLAEVADRSQALAREARGEAERAGPAGAGFARVALQMAEHAADARTASDQARALIGQVDQAMAQVLSGMQVGRQQAETGAQGAARTGQTIRSLAATIHDSSGAAREIATVAQQQDRGIEETLKAMNAIFLSVQEAVAQTARVAAQARALSDLAAGLEAQVHGE